MSHMTRPVVLFIALFTSALRGSPEQSELISLCQLFRNLDSHHAQRIRIRGTYRFGREVSGLYSGPCEETITVDDHEVIPHISLALSIKTGVSESNVANREAFRQAVADARTRPNAIVLTLTGTLKT